MFSDTIQTPPDAGSPVFYRDQGTGRVVELDWSYPDYEQVVETLRTPIPDFVIAADCLYIDEVSGSRSSAYFMPCDALAVLLLNREAAATMKVLQRMALGM